MEKWDKNDYQRIVAAKQNSLEIEVTFANGDRVSLALANILPIDHRNQGIETLDYNDFGLVINSFNIPWDKIRVLTDQEFAREMANQAEESAKEIGVKLKMMREAKKIKASDLADRAGVTSQTISRIEKGHTDVTFATLTKILAAMGYSLRDLAKVELAPKNAWSFNDVIKKLNTAGLSSSIVYKIIPESIQQRIISPKDPLPVLLYDEILSYLKRVLDISDSNNIESEKFEIGELPYKLAFYKTPAKVNVNQLRAYSHYAYFLAKLTSSINISIPKFVYPSDIDEFKLTYFKNYNTLNLNNLVDFCWNLGIGVLPLNDSGVFHGASWNIEGKHVIVLKQRSQSHAKWIFDLLHEVYHVFVHLENSNTSILETEEIDPFSDNLPTAEREANTFANQVIFGENSDKLALEILEMANYKIEFLKRSLEKVSQREQIEPAFLSNYLAYRLQHQGHNWWAVASSFQIVNPNPFEVVSNILREKISIDSLNPMDKSIFASAIIS